MTTRRIPEVFYGEINEGETPRLMQRIEDNTGTALTQSDVSTITYAVYATDDYATAVGTGSLIVADVIYEPLQTDDDAWNDEFGSTDDGWNFAWAATASLFPDGGTTYRVEVILTLASGQVVVLVFQVKVREVYSVS